MHENAKKHMEENKLNEEVVESTSETPKKKKRRKWVGWTIAGAVVLTLVLGVVVVWNTVLPNLDSAGYRYLLTNMIGTHFKSQENANVKACKEKTGDFATGVCHLKGYRAENGYTAEEKTQLAKEANINWERMDLTHIPYEGDDPTNLTPGYLAFKADCQWYVDHDMKVMCVTQYPSVFWEEAGLDCRLEADHAKIKEYAAFIAKDLQGYVSAFQITNEMTVNRFRDVKNDTDILTLAEAATYIGIQLEAMDPVLENTNIILGYNVADFSMMQFCMMMKEAGYHKYCDYLGIDLYLGCFESTFKDIFWYEWIARGFYGYTGLPIFYNEFGYMGDGKVKTRAEKDAMLLEKYGYENEEAARNDIWNFFNKLPESFQADLRRSFPAYGIEDEFGATPENLAHLIFDTEKVNHIYLEIQGGYELTKYPHTWEGQGEFFKDTLAKLGKLRFVLGAFIYCWSDGEACYVCGQTGCPVETGWGLLSYEGEKKPSYYAVKEGFGKIIESRR